MKPVIRNPPNRSQPHQCHTSTFDPIKNEQNVLNPHVLLFRFVFDLRPASHPGGRNTTFNFDRFLGRQNESPTESQDRLASPPGSSERMGERRPDAARSEAGRLRREIEGLNRQLEKQRADLARLRREEEKLTKDCERKGNRIVGLEHEIGQMRHSYQEDAQRRTQQLRAVEERLKLTEELLATRSAELSGTHAFLPTTDRLSEVEVLSIVRDLNENIYQVAVHLTEEWEKLESSQPTNRMDVDPTSQPRVPILVQLVRNRDPTGLTFLLQLYLCSRAAEMTLSWGRQQESASEGQAISARWRSLTHSYLSRPPPDSAFLVEQVANVLGNTGSFSSTQQSLEFVQAVALEGIDSIIRLLQRLEFAFMVKVTSNDMVLLFEAPDTVFDDERMADKFESDGATTSERQDRIAGTTEVGVGKA